jgi:hypothetical protein
VRDRIQGIRVAQMHMPVIRLSDGQAVHTVATGAGQPLRKRSNV